jgi:Protein of unknown function (DUF1566)
MSFSIISSLIRTIMGVLGAMLLMSVHAMGLSSDLGIHVQMPGSRFQILEEYRGEAVLDTETHLIWERTPSSSETAWANASLRCALSSTGGRLGWRLPSFFELMTLVEPPPPAAATKPSLPTGHPFRGVRADPYWTTSSQDIEPANAYAVDFLRGDVAIQRKTRPHAWWCVRGGAVDAPSASSRSQPQESI